jgi:ABC-2 type transport system ATP-binding protein
LTIEEGETYGLLGPNGAGKTTLLRLLLGFLKPTLGYARIDGLDCYRQSVSVHRLVAYLPAEARLFPTLRGRDILSFFAEVRGDGDLQRSLQLARRLDLDTSRRVAFMSTGMRQKLALVATLAAHARVLILDEPTASLDPNVRREVLAVIKEAQHEGRTIIFSSHILSDVESICGRVAVLRNGQLVHTQVMSELRRQHRVRARLTGLLPPIPEALKSQVTIRCEDDNAVVIDVPGALVSILSWLSDLPLADVTIEPLGLRTVYDEFHGNADGRAPLPRDLTAAAHEC